MVSTFRAGLHLEVHRWEVIENVIYIFLCACCYEQLFLADNWCQEDSLPTLPHVPYPPLPPPLRYIFYDNLAFVTIQDAHKLCMAFTMVFTILLAKSECPYLRPHLYKALRDTWCAKCTHKCTSHSANTVSISGDIAFLHHLLHINRKFLHAHTLGGVHATQQGQITSFLWPKSPITK